MRPSLVDNGSDAYVSRDTYLRYLPTWTGMASFVIPSTDKGTPPSTSTGCYDAYLVFITVGGELTCVQRTYCM